MTDTSHQIPDPFFGLKTTDHLPGYYSAAAAGAGILTLCSGKDDIVTVAGVIGLAVVALGCALLNARVVTARNSTIQVHTATSGGVEISDDE